MTAVSRKDVILPGDDFQDAARAIPLDIVVDSGGKSTRWSRLRVQLAEDKVGPPTSPTAHSPISVPWSRSPRRVHWSSSLAHKTSSSTTFSTQTTTQTKHSSYLSASIHLGSSTLPSAITDLCHTLRKGKYKTSTTTDCFGDISCKSSTFSLYHQDCEPDHLSTINLGMILEDQAAAVSLMTFNYTERLKLALSLSYSVLHLYKTPWLAKTVTPEDIVFLREQQQASTNTTYHLSRPFLAKTLADSAPGPAQIKTQAEGRPMDFTILSLGLLLIQIIIGRQISDLALDPDMRMKSTLSKKEIALKYIASVIESGGINYADAVQWCLRSILSVACLDDDKFAQDFYDAVITRLEGDLSLQSLMTVSGGSEP